MVRYIIKRDGRLEDFNWNKIRSAIEKAAFAIHLELEKVALDDLCASIKDTVTESYYSEIPTIENIQDIVEQSLYRADLFKLLRAYIAYREKHALLRSDKHAFIDAVSSVSEYVDREDWRVNANANQGYSLGGLILNVSGKVTANYWLKHVYSPEVANAHIHADLHIHDLDLLSGYCAGWSLRALLNEGFNGVPNKTESCAPKHFSSALSQMVNFLGTLQNEWAGAQAFSSFDTYLAPYVFKDQLSYAEVKQHIQTFIFNLNTPSRWGSQTPFTNLTFDLTVPNDLKKQVPMRENNLLLPEFPEKTYKDFTHEMSLINNAFLEVMIEGDSKGRVFTFPIPTYNITEEFNWEDETMNLIFEVTAKYGLPYFQNFMGSQYIQDENGNRVRNPNAYTPGAVRSMCCRLQLDLNELLKRGGGLFGSAEMTGSIGVVTLNCARLGYMYKNDFIGLYKALDRLLYLAKESLETKRKAIIKFMDEGLYPYSKRYLGHFRNHFSTIGVNGINEMILNFTSGVYNVTDEEGAKIALEFLEYIRKRMKEYQNETGNLYNLEATPAEGTTYRFAKEDKKRYPEIIQAGFGEHIYYTNSSQIPVGYTDDPFNALDLQDELQCKYTGGTVLHLYLGEKVSSVDACKHLVKTVLTHYKLPYITITPAFSICPVHNYLDGEHKFCPKCDEVLSKTTGMDLDHISVLPDDKRTLCEIWTRVMGYYRPVSYFNIGKKGEFYERLYFNEEA